MDLILSLSALASAFAATWILFALLFAALAGGLVVMVFGSIFVLASRLATRASRKTDPN